MLNDLAHLTKFNYTGQLQVYHASYNNYGSKQLHFSWNGMVDITELIILDNNSGTERAYVQTKDRKQRCKLFFPKVAAN